MTDWKAQARRIAHARVAADPARLAALWAEAEAEAWQEVRAVLKTALVEALLAEMGAGERGSGGAEASGGVGEGGDEPLALVLGPSSVVSDQSSVDAVQGSGFKVQGSAVSGQPSVVSGQSSVDAVQGSRFKVQGPTVGGQPSAVGGQPSVVSGQSSVDAVQGSRFKVQGSAVGGQPSVDDVQPSTFDLQPSAVGGQPSIVHRPPPTGIYVYAIIDRTDLTELPGVGVAEGCPVTLQIHGDLAAVVSEVPLAEFGEEALHANLGNLEWLEARVRAHQNVLDALLPQVTVLPMKFATIYLDSSGVATLLAARYDELTNLLGQLQGRQEWGLKLFCDECQLVAHIAEVSPEIARLKAEIAAKPKGAAYLFARKLQEAETQEAERISLAVADHAHTSLADPSVATRMNPLQDCRVTGRTEVMLLNAAYLVENTRLDEFRAALAGVAAEHNGLGFQCELSGPWPAYNFVRLSEEA
jgi:hypothetical protein